MSMPIPQPVYTYPYRPSLPSGFARTSNHPTLIHPSHNHEHTLENERVTDKKPSINRSPLVSHSTFSMHQHNTSEPPVGVPSRLCSVCGDVSTGIHFGGNSCESCKAFFRRSVQCNRFQNYKCSNEERCPVNVVTRKVCQFCRYTKCTATGMKPKWVLSDQEREEKYGARRKRFRENRTTDEDPDIYKFLTKEEKLLIEDIAHALYQSRATYPLNFPNASALLSNAPNTSVPVPATTQASTSDKPASAPANFLIVPIQRLVLFARMLKDFDLFSEDDKVCLLKGSAIEIMVCSSTTLFNPKTHTFTNYLSRDQQALMDEQILPLDPLLIKLWGEEIFTRTRSFLISMCNLHIDEVTSTLLVPIILFSPDRLNIKDLDLVKRLQEKYAALLRKYMNWRYGVEQAERIYPRLLLQATSIRSLSSAHGEIIQKFIATSNVNPLVQEIAVKPELFTRTTTEKMDSLSISSSPSDADMLDFDKTPSNEGESNNGSDDDDSTKKKIRPFDDLLDDDNDDDETDLHNIWRKRRKLHSSHQLSSAMQTESKTSSGNQGGGSMASYKNVDKYPKGNCLYMKPHDHQVPAIVPVHRGDGILVTNSGYTTQNSLGQALPPMQAFAASPHSIQQLKQLYQANSSPSNDLSSYEYHSALNAASHNSTLSPPSEYYYEGSTYDPYGQQYAHAASANYQQDFRQRSSGNDRNHTPPVQSLTNPHAQSITSFPARSADDDNEQYLLNAIQAHPNKRDLLLNLLRQMEQSSSSTQSRAQTQEHRSDPSTTTKPHENEPMMGDSDDSL